MADRTFCATIVDGSFRPINVQVKRFECSSCGNVFEGGFPFYDRCNNGAPIVDLCFDLAASNSYNRVESIPMPYGIQVDKDTIRNYAMCFRANAMNHGGIPVMDDAKIGLNVLEVIFEVDDVEELKKRHPGKYDALVDETYPRVKGAKRAGLNASQSTSLGTLPSLSPSGNRLLYPGFRAFLTLFMWRGTREKNRTTRVSFR